MTHARPSFDRRHFLKTSAGALLLPALGAVPAARAAAPRKLAVATWGGDYRALLDRYVVEPLVTPQGIEVVYDTADWQTRSNRIRAEKDARRSSADLAFFGDTESYALSRAALLEPLDAGKIANWDHILPQFRTDYAVPHIFSGMGIVYSTEFVKDAPQSLDDLFSPAFKGKFGFSDIMFNNNVASAALTASGNPNDYDAGIAFLRRFKAQQPRIYPSNEALASALKTGEIHATVIWKARALMWQKSGLPVAFAAPKEGLYTTVYEAVIPRSSRNKAEALVYANALLDPAAQIGFADVMGYAPVVDNARLPDDLRAKVGFTDNEQARLVRLDPDAQIRARPAVLDFWNKEFKVGL